MILNKKYYICISDKGWKPIQRYKLDKQFKLTSPFQPLVFLDCIILKMEIMTIPKEVKNIDDFLEWLRPKETHTILAYTKRKNKHCFKFSLNKETQKIEYLMNDGVSVGKCKFENLNRYLYFTI